nr:hypothetical protein CFP56_31527 [Quercus suber]
MESYPVTSLALSRVYQPEQLNLQRGQSVAAICRFVLTLWMPQYQPMARLEAKMRRAPHVDRLVAGNENEIAYLEAFHASRPTTRESLQRMLFRRDRERLYTTAGIRYSSSSGEKSGSPVGYCSIPFKAVRNHS